jgi:nucleoid-associated protein YgaU
MKSFEIKNLSVSFQNTDLSNLFNVYEEDKTSDNTLYFNINRTLNLNGLDNISKRYFTTYRIVNEDTWAKISYKFYNTTRLWWLVCKVNKIYNPTIDPEPNTDIMILTKDFVKSIEDLIKVS